MAEVYLEYDSGIVATVRPASEGLPTRAYADAQIDDGVPGKVVRLGSVEAYVVPPTAQEDLGSVRIVLDGVTITIIGDGDVTEQDLVGVASSVVETAP